MNVLVVNIGSTSFKFRLFDMNTERMLARGGVEGVGQPTSKVTLQVGDATTEQPEQHIADQAAAVAWCLKTLAAPPTGAALAIDAVGFKAVHGGPIAHPARVNDDVIRIMEQFVAAAPAHNPPYIAAMRAFEQQMPKIPLVAAFETGFHQTIPPSRTTFAVPYEWTVEYGVRRYGFHGASHRYIATRTAELLERNDLRIVSCHLGGSSSLCAIERGRSVANSLGMTPQSGLPQNNRVGDFDVFALPTLLERTGKPLDELLRIMSKEGGLLGISGVSNDMPELIAAADGGHPLAVLALDTYVESIRHYLGAYVVALGGLDALVFTGGIGERSALVRRRVCAGLGFLGIELDQAANDAASSETLISTATVRVLVVPTNEELIVARQTRATLED